VGLPGLALGHLVLHGLFKARLFLGAGEALEQRPRAEVAPSASPAVAALALSLLPALGAVIGWWSADGRALLWGFAGLVSVQVLTSVPRGAGVAVLAVGASLYAVAVGGVQWLLGTPAVLAAPVAPAALLVAPLFASAWLWLVCAAAGTRRRVALWAMTEGLPPPGRMFARNP